MQQLNLKPTHKLVKNYYEALGQFGQLSIDHEGAVRAAFHDLLASCGRRFDLTLVDEYFFQPPKLHPIRIDGALLNAFKLARGYWEAKDEHDDLEKEIRAKFERGYPRSNIIFQAPERAVLYQHGVRQGLNEDIRDANNLVELLKQFFAYREPHIEEWDDAVAEFKDHIPQLAEAVKEKIEEQRRSNSAFVERFNAFYEVCRQSINPNLSVEAVEKMLIQHLLTERIFRRIFDNPDFTRRNVVAVEIEKVIDSMTRREFSRDAFLKDLDRFYKAVELAAENTETYKEKQAFLNTVYERFFQGYSPKEADTHGIVYTPQPIVDFMVRSVEDILKKEFGRSLSDKGVHILDPFVGTGNFITRVMQEIRTSALPYKYENELHCNEVMLLPYYIASMNIEHAYMERTGEYKPFPGICLVDTFDMRAQGQMFTEENLDRIEKQRQSQIFVVISNPPYNAWQVNESDNNKNRRYLEEGGVDTRVAETYSKRSRATNKNALSDPYVKAFRWASDRIKEEGVVAFVSNSGFLDALAGDGMREALRGEFDEIYVLDLGGNVRKNPKLSGTTHNVFGIQVGVCISLLIRRKGERESRRCKVFRAEALVSWRKEKKYEYLDTAIDRNGITWTNLSPDRGEPWDFVPRTADFGGLVSITEVFAEQSRGVATSRDAWAYNFNLGLLKDNIERTARFYNDEVARSRHEEVGTENVDTWVNYEDRSISWSRDLKQDLLRRRVCSTTADKFRAALYRPYARQQLFFDRVLNEEVYVFPEVFPTMSAEQENTVIALTGPGSEKPFLALVSRWLVDLHLSGAGCSTQCFPFYTYDADGTNRRENITDWALDEFRTHYGDPNITKWDIFHHVYAVLHHPEYRERYAANLKRELPRIPFVGAAEGSGRAGLQASDRRVAGAPSTLPKASAQPLAAERLKETADPSATLRSARDDSSARSGRAGPSTGSGQALQAGVEVAPLDIGAGLQPGGTVPDARTADPSAPPLRGSARDDSTIFWRFVEAGRNLADIHVNYEQQIEYSLERVEKGQLNWRVEKMRLNKDKTMLVYNDFLTLRGIPPETYEYRLGNRSALEWVIDQYQVSTDKRSGISNDPNRADDPEYIVRLIGQVITVSLETMKIVKALPELGLQPAELDGASIGKEV